jgi:hypothetical protein
MKGTPGFAIKERDGTLNVRTVSPTARAAMVNWLVVSGIVPFDHWSDELISYAFRTQGEREGATLVKVYILEAPNDEQRNTGEWR